MSAPPTPADSAAVLLLREPSPGRVEVLLVRRHADSRAFGGAHVFPGGRIDAADADPVLIAAASPFRPEDAAERLGENRPPPAALAVWIGAIREVFEEAGVLLATRNGEHPAADPEAAHRLADDRRALVDSRLSFAAFVARERLTLAATELAYFSRWITPVNAPRRFDARFFVARFPEGQAALHDDRETTAADWFAPAAAVAAAQEGTLTLTPPTVRNLEDIAALGSIDRIFATAAHRKVEPILPKVSQADGRVVVLYPGDADYGTADGTAELPADTPGPRNRFVMEGSGWRSVRRP